MRALRSSLIEVMNSDYVTTGVAMGLRPVTRLTSYLLRNGLTPFISTLGLNIGWLIGGTIIIVMGLVLMGVLRGPSERLDKSPIGRADASEERTGCAGWSAALGVELAAHLDEQGYSFRSASPVRR